MIIDRLAYNAELEGDDAESEGNTAADTGGTPYKVIHQRLAIRDTADVKAEIIASLQQGDIVNLLEYDSTHRWRRHFAKEVQQYGWVLLEHDQFGKLVTQVSQ